MKRISNLDEIDEPCTMKLIAHLRSVDPNYGNQIHQLRFVERMAEFQRRMPCPGGKITCGDGWHSSRGQTIEKIVDGKTRKEIISCYDPVLMKAISQEQYLRDK